MDTYLIAKIIACVLIGIPLGPMASVVLTPIFCVLRTIFFVPFIRKKLQKEAIKKGHVVEATLQKFHSLGDEEGIARMREMGTYTYQVNGKKYKYQAIGPDLPNTLTLYYLKKPRKATVGGELGNWEWPWFKFYVIISLLVTIVTVIVGMIIW